MPDTNAHFVNASSYTKVKFFGVIKRSTQQNEQVKNSCNYQTAFVICL